MYSGSLLIHFHFFPLWFTVGISTVWTKLVLAWCKSFSPTPTLTALWHVKNSACIILHEFELHMSPEFSLIPTQYVQLSTDSMSVWTVKTCTSLQHRVAWNDLTNIHHQRQLMPCRSDIMDIVSQNHSTQCTCSYLHGPLCVGSFSLSKCICVVCVSELWHYCNC